MCIVKELNRREEMECGVRVSGIENNQDCVEGDSCDCFW